MKILTIFTALSLPATFCAKAESGLQTSAYRNSIAQDEVRQQTADVRQQLGLLLEDIQLNQFNTPEAEIARQAAASLDSLGDDQIVPLIQMLKAVGAMESNAKVQGKLVDASKEQKNIEMSLKSMADTLSLHRDQASILSRLQQLILRQTTNLRQTREIAATGKPEEIANLCQTEQSALQQEVDLTFATLQRLVNDLPPERKGGFSGALESMKSQSVPALAATASDETASGKFSTAVHSQDRLKNALQVVLLSLKSDQSVQEKTQALAAQMKELAAEQKALNEATAKAPDAAKRDLRETQQQVADQLAAVQKEVQDVNAGAAADAKKAADAMQAAAEALKAGKNSAEDQVAAAQQEAVEQLEKASDALAQTADQLANDTPPINAAQAADELAKLSQAITDAQAQAHAQPAQHEELTESVQQLQQDALSTNPEAAKSLGEAAASLQENQAQEAAQALAEANAEIQQQMQAVAQAAAKGQQMQALTKEIAEAKALANQANQSLQTTQPGQAQMEAINKTEEAQRALQEAQQAAGGASPEVKQALQQAQQALQKSKMDAAQMKKDASASANAAAQAAMQNAMKSIKQSMAAALAQAMPSQPESNPMAPQQGAEANSQVQDGQSGSGMSVSMGIHSPDFIGNEGGTADGVRVAAGLKPKDRDAVALLQKEKAPSEYQGMAGQYLKNLASGESPASPLP